MLHKTKVIHHEPLGIRKFHILALIHIGSRKVRILGISQTPNQYWIVQRAEELAKYFKTQGKPPLLLFHDRDKRFIYGFNPTLKRHGLPVQAITPYSPNLNAHMERWIKSIKEECLNHYIVFGEHHLRYLVDEYVTFYNTLRPHQGKDNKPLTPQKLIPEPSEDDLDNIICESRLGGLLKHYRYAA